MTTYQVEFTMDAPDNATEQQVEAFLRYELGQDCMLMPGPMEHGDLSTCNVRCVSARQEYGGTQ